MKKICLLLATLIVIGVGIGVFADVVTTTRRLNPENQNVQQNIQQRTRQNIAQPQTNLTGNKLADSVKMCKPYSESLNTNVSGLDFNFKVTIKGWVNDKCHLYFAAQSTGINEMFESLYGFDRSMAKITTFEPKIRCEFTKSQLNLVGDSILQEQERNNGAKSNMLKNPQEIQIPTFGSLSESDSKLMNVILKDRACNILNAPDSNQMFESLFMF